MQPNIPSVTRGTAFTLKVPVLVLNDRNCATPVLADDIASFWAKVRFSESSGEWLTCSVEKADGMLLVDFACDDLTVCGYYDIEACVFIGENEHRIAFRHAFGIVEYTDRVVENNCATRPAILSNYGATDEVLEQRIAALRIELQTANDAKNTALNSLTRRNTEYNNLATEYNQLLAEYNALINGGGVTPDIPSGDTLPDLEDYDFYDFVDFQEVTPDSITSVLLFRAGLRSVSTNRITKITHSCVFYGCTRLQSVSLPLLTSISGGYTFSGCTALQRLYFPECTRIGGGDSSFFASCTRLHYIFLGHPSLSFSLSTWNPTYWTGTPSAGDVTSIEAEAEAAYTETQGGTVTCSSAIDALAVLFFVGIIDRLYDLRTLVPEGSTVTSLTLTLNSAFKTKLATSSLWAGFVATANEKGWSIA